MPCLCDPEDWYMCMNVDCPNAGGWETDDDMAEDEEDPET